jgi:predicted esterase
MASAAPKLRVLCLHGFSMSGGALQSHMRRVTSALEPHASFTFLDAPHTIARHPMVPISLLGDGDARAWWVPTQRADRRWDFAGVDESIEHVRLAQVTEVARIGSPFDALLGFSQGAGLASLLVALQQTPHPSRPIAHPVRFACFLGGFQFAPATPNLSSDFRGAPFALPSLHVYGTHDTIVRPRQGIKLAALFSEDRRVCVEHEGGHVVAEDAISLRAYSAFFEARGREGITGQAAHTSVQTSTQAGRHAAG